MDLARTTPTATQHTAGNVGPLIRRPGVAVIVGASVLAGTLTSGCRSVETAGAASVREDAGRVTLMKTPDGGIQPQAMVDASGTLHLIAFKGNPGAGDLFYYRRSPGSAGFSDPSPTRRMRMLRSPRACSIAAASSSTPSPFARPCAPA